MKGAPVAGTDRPNRQLNWTSASTSYGFGPVTGTTIPAARVARRRNSNVTPVVSATTSAVPAGSKKSDVPRWLSGLLTCTSNDGVTPLTSRPQFGLRYRYQPTARSFPHTVTSSELVGILIHEKPCTKKFSPLRMKPANGWSSVLCSVATLSEPANRLGPVGAVTAKPTENRLPVSWFQSGAYFRIVVRSPKSLLVPPRPGTLLSADRVLTGRRRPIEALPSRHVFSRPKK